MARFSVYTPSDHRAPLWILTILSLLYSALFLLVRLAIKRSFWGPDDLVLGLSHVFAFGQWAVVMCALNDGLGKTIGTVKPDSAATAAALAFSSTVLNLIALGLSKCSVVLFLRLLFTKENKTCFRLCTICVAIVAVWTIAAPLIVSVGCSASHAARPESTSRCPGDVARWKAVAVIDVLLELGLIALPAYLFSTLRMKLERKLTVTAAFAFRLGVAAIFIVYVVTYVDSQEQGRRSLDAVTPLLWQQVLLVTALLTATVPCLKGFLGRFKTLDLVTISESAYGYGRSYGSKNRSFALSSMDRKNGGKGKEPAPDEFPIQAGGEHMAIAYAAPAAGDRTGSMRSLASDEMIIHRKVEWEITPNDALG